MKKRKFGIGRISNNPKKTGTFFSFYWKVWAITFSPTWKKVNVSDNNLFKSYLEAGIPFKEIKFKVWVVEMALDVSAVFDLVWTIPNLNFQRTLKEELFLTCKKFNTVVILLLTSKAQ